MNEAALQNRATSVIEALVPPDAEERVIRSYKQWNQIVRDHIRTETGLKLSDGDNRFSIPVRVVPGFPVKLATLIDQCPDPAMWRLIIGQPQLGGLLHGLDFLLKNWGQFEIWPTLPEVAKGGRPVMEKCLEIASSLQKVALAEKVRQRIKEIDDDILGVYRYPSGQTSFVELYWLAIAMAAAMLSVAIEDLTVVVLTHELAHAYTHLGRDIDGARWGDEEFDKSALEVREGLAQFYTEVICEHLAPRTPGFLAAFQALLSLQSPPYLVHRDWLACDKTQRGETIRFALIAARSWGRITHDKWRELMAATTQKLSHLF